MKYLINIESKDKKEILNQELFEWEIENWTDLKSIEYSYPFNVSGYKWYFQYNSKKEFCIKFIISKKYI